MNMKFKISAGEFKHPIEILRKGPGEKDDDGIMRYKPINLFFARAKILNVSGNEYLQAFGENSKIVKKFYIRYNKEIEVLQDDIIEYKKIQYNIKHPNNIEEANRYLEILAEVVQ